MRDDRQVWIGLEGSYSAGRLVGRWVDACDCDDDGIAALLLSLQTEDPMGGEELSIMDTQGSGPHPVATPPEFRDLLLTLARGAR